MVASLSSSSLPLVLILTTLSYKCWSLHIPAAWHGLKTGHIGSSVVRRMSSNNDGDRPSTDSSTKVKFFELDDAFEDDGENVVGTKFFGGNTVK